MMLTDNQMAKLKEKVSFDFETNKWIVPPFVVKQKEVAFPKIQMAMNLVREEKQQREIIINDTNEHISAGSDNAQSRMNDSRAMTGQFGKGHGSDNMQQNSAQNSRNAKHRQNNSGDMLSPGEMGENSQRQGLRERWAAENSAQLDLQPYSYEGKQSSASSSQRQIYMQEKYANKYKKEGSSLNMVRNDSDLSSSNINFGGNQSSAKYASLDRGNGASAEQQEVSSPERRKKANVHL